MPTANKESKPVAPQDIQDPQKLVQNLVDKKIRNLEKRKTRLEELKELSAKGKELEAEQQKAVKKLDQVVEMIDLMKDLNKSISEVLAENTKQQKRLAKKELLDRQQERQQQELTRLKTIIQYQEILGRFDSPVRQDFSKGTNGAIKLSEDQLKQLDDLYSMTSDVTDPNIETTAEKLIALADGKTREAWPGVTFQQLKELMTSIVETKYFSHETAITTTTTSSKAKTHNSIDVSKTTKVSEESIKSFTNETELTNATKTTSSTQFHSLPNPEYSTPALNQLQNQFVGTGLSFMNNPLEKDPAVVAVASVPNSYSYPTSFGLTSDSLINTSIPDPNNSSLNPPKSSNYENTSSMSTIPTQTFTNQHYSALIPNAGAVYSVPVTLATVPVSMTGLVAQDLSGQVSTDLMATHTYANQQNFINSNAPDKHPNPSHEQRGTYFTSEDNFRNNRPMRGSGNRPENQKKNLNGSGSRLRNPNKGPGYQNQTSSFGNQFNSKYDNQLNGSSTFGNNSFGDKYPNNSNNFSGTRGRPQQNRPNRADNSRQQRINPNVAYNPNFGTTAAK